MVGIRTPMSERNVGAAGFATLQADVVGAMAKAGQRGSRGMGDHPVAAISSSNLAP